MCVSVCDVCMAGLQAQVPSGGALVTQQKAGGGGGVSLGFPPPASGLQTQSRFGDDICERRELE